HHNATPTWEPPNDHLLLRLRDRRTVRRHRRPGRRVRLQHPRLRVMKPASFRAAFFVSCLLATSVAAAEEGSLDNSLRIGGNIEVTEPTDGGLHALGGRISVDAPVSGSLRAAGGKIEVGSNAVIGGSASLAGGHIAVKGSIGGDLHAAGGQITIDGPVAGDAHVAGGTLTLGPDARISGKLKFRGGELIRDANAQVVGGTIHSNSRSPR